MLRDCIGNTMASLILLLQERQAHLVRFTFQVDDTKVHRSYVLDALDVVLVLFWVFFS